MADEIETRPLEELFALRRPEEVREFLQDHPFLLPLLREGHGQIRQCFPSDPLFLQVVFDPEDAGGAHLVAFISSDQPPAIAFAQLRKLDAGWWLDAMDRAQGKFLINLEFR
jgi:hypothetical protein